MVEVSEACKRVRGLQFSTLEDLADAIDGADWSDSRHVTGGDTLTVVQTGEKVELFVTTISGLVLRGEVTGK